MKTEIVPIGNSRGVRIPKALLAETGLKETVEITVRPEGLLISPARKPRAGWSERFAAAGPAPLLIPDGISNDWDASEWDWPAG
jgi:antitoxin MazE